MEAKICTICKSLKNTSEFYKRKTGKPYSNCIICDKIRKKNSAISNPDTYKQRDLKYRLSHQPKIKAYKKYHYRKNKEYYSHKCKLRRTLFPEKYREYNNKYVANRIAVDPLFKLKKNIRGLITVSIKCCGFRKKGKTTSILGCSFNEFKDYLASKFVGGMSWDNRNLWHIDHIIPMAVAKTEAEVIKLNHYTNLQPLWAEDNLSKGAKTL